MDENFKDVFGRRHKRENCAGLTGKERVGPVVDSVSVVKVTGTALTPVPALPAPNLLDQEPFV